MKVHDLLLVIIAFVSEVTGTVSGFGSSTFFVPAAVFLETFAFVLALTAILHCFGNLSKILIFRRHFPTELIVRLAVPSMILAGVGALLSAYISVNLLSRLLGFTLILVSAFAFLNKKRPVKIGMASASAVCGLSGLMTGLVGTGGAIRGMALTALGIDRNAFVAVSAGIDLGGDLIRAAIYLYKGYMDWNQWFYIPALGAAAVQAAVLKGAIFTSATVP